MTYLNKLAFTLSIVALSLFATKANADLLVSSLKERASIIDQVLAERFNTVLPSVMERANIDMWIIMSREYNEDPILKTMLPASWMSARRHTMLVIYNPGKGRPLELLSVSRYGMGDLFKQSWNNEQQPNQWAALTQIIADRQPAKIAINKDRHFALADGITASEYELFMQALPQHLHGRVVSSRPLAIGWLETRSPQEIVIYKQLVATGHQLIARAFSNEVVVAGKTSTEDIVWWLRSQSAALNLGNWFIPTVSLQRPSSGNFDQITAFSNRPGGEIIQPGDLLHVDFGITYLRLNTDQQQHAYVLKKNEIDAPSDIKAALAQGNQLQDILMAGFKTGITGNQLLAQSLTQAKGQGLSPSIYTHPLGLHGHAAGPTIGMWDAQHGVPVQGDYPVYPNTAYSIELNIAAKIASWNNQEIRIMLEEDAFFDGEQIQFLSGRQTQLHLIK